MNARELRIENESLLKALSGTLLLHDIFQDGSIRNKDGMAVIEYLDKPNGGCIAYIRHDAMVKKLNALIKTLKDNP